MFFVWINFSSSSFTRGYSTTSLSRIVLRHVSSPSGISCATKTLVLSLAEPGKAPRVPSTAREISKWTCPSDRAH